jgi:hypothetical protein
MVVVIELTERHPPVGTICQEGRSPSTFDGWLGLISALGTLLDDEDERLSRDLAVALDREAERQRTAVSSGEPNSNTRPIEAASMPHEIRMEESE